MALTEDLEEVVSLVPDRSQDEQESMIRNNSSIADSSASNTDGQYDRRVRFISTLNMLKDLLKAERKEEQHGEGSKIKKPVLKVFDEILEKLKNHIENPSSAVDLDLVPIEKLKHLERQWNKMSPLESNQLRSVLFVMLSQLQSATLTMWGPEEFPTIQVRKIVQKLLVFVRTTRTDNECNFHLQRNAANEIWRLNRLHKYRNRIIKEGESYVDKLSMELVKLNKVLLSSSIEQMVVLWPSLEYYAQERIPYPVHMSRENSDACFQNLTNVHQSCRGNGRNLKGMEWLHLSLNEILVEQQEWADITIRQLRSRNGGISADMYTKSIDSILLEALSITSTLLGLGADSKQMYGDGDDESCSMLRIEYLDKEKFGNTFGKDVIDTINQLISLNHISLRLRWSLDSFIEVYVRGRESEGDAEHDQNICASCFAYGNRYIFNNIYIPYADATIANEDGNVTTVDKMADFLEKFQRQISVITDNKSLPIGDAVVHHVNLKEYAPSWWQNTSAEDSQNKEIEERLRGAYGPGRRGGLPVDSLFFDVEKDAMRELLDSPGESVLENLDRVAESITKQGQQSWSSTDFLYSREDKILRKAIIAVARGGDTAYFHRATNFQVYLPMLFPVLYLLDILTDCNLVYHHFSQSNYIYSSLTVLFLLGPILAEITRNFFLKLKNRMDTWKNVFSLNSLRLIPRSLKSAKYAVNSRRKFDKDMDLFYTKLNGLRRVCSEELLKELRRCKISSINAYYYAMIMENEVEQVKWRMDKALNNSAPQALLQLVITIKQLVKGETVGPWTFIGILLSLLSFSWTLHLYHYYDNYGGLKNNIKLSERAINFSTHFSIVCCRFIAVSSVMALYPMWFVMVAYLYQGSRFIFLHYFSQDRIKYRLLMTNTNNPLWMVHRLFVTPYFLEVRRINMCDDVLYYLETFVLIAAFPFLLDGVNPLEGFWKIPTVATLILNFFLLPFTLSLIKRS
ncbi:uncharacterized protein LOC124172032 isoform X2 [Ischnura elegans]|nr:uncharacterized protein LOC124172032 isoform X2 [Ischnura elegans]